MVHVVTCCCLSSRGHKTDVARQLNVWLVLSHVSSLSVQSDERLIATDLCSLVQRSSAVLVSAVAMKQVISGVPLSSAAGKPRSSHWQPIKSTPVGESCSFYLQLPAPLNRSESFPVPSSSTSTKMLISTGWILKNPAGCENMSSFYNRGPFENQNHHD